MKKTISIGHETLAYIDRGEGEVILFIHGNMSSSVHYLPLIEKLSKNYRCVAVDLRGFGDSTYNNRFDSLKELSEDVNLFLEALGIESCYVVGWSTGGGIGLQLAADHPDKVKKYFSIEGASHRGYPIYVKDAKYQSTGKAYESKEALASDPLQVAPMVGIFEKKDGTLMASIWDATIYTVNKPSKEYANLWIEETLKQRNLVDIDWSLATFNMSNDATPYGMGDGSIAKVTCPTAFTTGEKDIVVPSYMVMDNYNALRANSKLYAYPNCGHSPIVDCLDVLAKDIQEFFA